MPQTGSAMAASDLLWAAVILYAPTCTSAALPVLKRASSQAIGAHCSPAPLSSSGRDWEWGPLSGSPLRAGEGLGVRFLRERLPEALAARHLAQRLALLLARADLLRRIAERHDRQQVYALRNAEHRLDGGRIASAHPVAADPARPRRQ